MHRALVFLILFYCWSAAASELVEVLPLTDQIIMLHFNEGQVIHHQRGQSRSDETVIISPLDTEAASHPATYTVRSPDDERYQTAQVPVQVGRKSKGTDFAWFVDKWENGRVVNTRPDHTKEHWVYLFLPQGMKRGRTYLVSTGSLASNGSEWKLVFDEGKARSEAVHVNLLGYVPAAPQKFGYVYHWLGDKGGLDLKAYEGNRFEIIDRSTERIAFSGKLQFRRPATQQETFHKADSPPDGNFLRADVYECDFSGFTTPGKYVLSVKGIGCSFPFSISPDIYREAFRTVARGLYHNRSGIALEKPYTEFTRPAPHNPKLTPGFAGKLIYTSIRFTEWGSEGGNAAQLLAASKGPIESAGWYQDAGDWDSYYSHLRVAQELLLAYEMAPRHFTDGELNIPESGNGVPDILDEAAWLPRFCYRLRHELMDKHYGTGGLGLRIAGDAFGEDEKTLPDGKRVGQGSWEDVNRTWAASGEDPWSTYRYAGAAAHLAFCLDLAHAKDPAGIDWTKEAVEAYDWAQKNSRPGDEQKGPALREPRAYAAAALFRITGVKEYERQFAADTADIQSTTTLWDDRQYGPLVYALGSGKGQRDSGMAAKIEGAVLATADHLAIEVASKRALRWGGNWSMPMLVGQQTTPWMLQAAVGYTLAREKDPVRAERYLAALYTTCDYFLGCNALNMTWITGLGPRHPRQVFHMDAWYNGKGEFHPGIIPYGPWRKQRAEGQGPWDVAWPHKTVYPPIDDWPGNERWFENRCSPMNSEFTIHQNIAPAAALFGFLCAANNGTKSAIAQTASTEDKATAGLERSEPPYPNCTKIFNGANFEGWEADPSTWSIVEGAMRGVGGTSRLAYTKADYGSFRLIFTARMNPVNGDHLGVLFWGDCPTDVSKPKIDNAGWIQFMPPFAGMWDYHPPKHHNLPHEKIAQGSNDSTRWCTTEILCNLEKGTLRAAVDGVELARYTHPTPAERIDPEKRILPGPIGLFRHGGGASEYRDVYVEANPKDDVLITVKTPAAVPPAPAR